MEYTQLATAIEYKSKINFYEYKNYNDLYYDKQYGSIYDVITIDEHISVAVVNYRYDKSCDYVYLKTAMYLDGIRVNYYRFGKGRAGNDVWELEIKKIIHKIPNEIIQKVNDWSKQIVNKIEEKDKTENL